MGKGSRLGRAKIADPTNARAILRAMTEVERSLLFDKTDAAKAPSPGRWRRLGREGLILGTLTVAWVACSGYTFGFHDHAIHLPFLLREVDPGFLPSDPLLAAADHHPSLFWWYQAQLLAFFSPEALYLLLHLVSVVALLAGLAYLAAALWPGLQGQWAGLLAPILILGKRGTWASIPTFDSLLLNRTLSLGPLLFALAFAAQRRYRAAFIVAGLTFTIHPTTAAHAAVLIFFAALFDQERRRALPWDSLYFFVAAAPLLFLMATESSTAGVSWPPAPEWRETVRLAWPYHHFLRDFSLGHWLTLVVPTAILAGALHYRPSRPLLGFLAGTAAHCLGGWVGIEVIGLPSVIQLHPYESTRFLPYLAAAAAAGWVASTWRWPLGPTWRELPWPVLAACGLALDQAFARTLVIDDPKAVFSIPVVLAGVALAWVATPPREALREFLPSRPLSLWISPLLALAVVSVILVGKGPPALIFGLDQAGRLPSLCAEHPGAQAGAADSDLQDLCGLRLMEWGREHLPEDAVVVVPPYFLHPLVSLRYASRRALFATWKDGSESLFGEAYAREWRERLTALTGGSPALDTPPADRRFPYRQWRARVAEAQAAYRRGREERFLGLRDRYGATHVVVEAGGPELKLPRVYADSAFQVYRLALQEETRSRPTDPDFGN
jgi:hypothetical protein